MRNRRYYYKKNKVIIGFIVIIPLVIILLLIYGFLQLFSTEHKVVHVVEEFYQLEQEGDFSNSWELFHSTMKERFDKSAYIQDRAHVFLEHFGVERFEFRLSDVNKIENFQVDEESLLPQTAYQLNVTYIYESKYGYLEIMQPVFVVEEDEKLTILWEY